MLLGKLSSLWLGSELVSTECYLLPAFSSAAQQAEKSEQFGKERLKAIIRANRDQSPQVIGDAIIAELDAYRGSDRPQDDVTMVLMKRT